MITYKLKNLDNFKNDLLIYKNGFLILKYEGVEQIELAKVFELLNALKAKAI